MECRKGMVRCRERRRSIEKGEDKKEAEEKGVI